VSPGPPDRRALVEGRPRPGVGLDGVGALGIVGEPASPGDGVEVVDDLVVAEAEGEPAGQPGVFAVERERAVAPGPAQGSLRGRGGGRLSRPQCRRGRDRRCVLGAQPTRLGAAVVVDLHGAAFAQPGPIDGRSHRRLADAVARAEGAPE
jgi:hypothetical protein